jgi:hypothetical protein
MSASRISASRSPAGRRTDDLAETNSRVVQSELWPGESRPAVLDPADILTPQELAERLKVRKSWVFEQTRTRSKVRNKNPLPCLRMGKLLRFSWTAVSDWLAESNR